MKVIYHSRDQGVNRKIILVRILSKQRRRVSVDLKWLRVPSNRARQRTFGFVRKGNLLIDCTTTSFWRRTLCLASLLSEQENQLQAGYWSSLLAVLSFDALVCANWPRHPLKATREVNITDNFVCSRTVAGGSCLYVSSRQLSQWCPHTGRAMTANFASKFMWLSSLFYHHSSFLSINNYQLRER